MTPVTVRDQFGNNQIFKDDGQAYEVVGVLDDPADIDLGGTFGRWASSRL
ncbi:MAG: hypothetical protein WBH10_04735 [Allopontixanthobacter sediminis]